MTDTNKTARYMAENPPPPPGLRGLEGEFGLEPGALRPTKTLTDEQHKALADLLSDIDAMWDDAESYGPFYEFRDRVDRGGRPYRSIEWPNLAISRENVRRTFGL
jgi:hypothetical protein